VGSWKDTFCPKSTVSQWTRIYSRQDSQVFDYSLLFPPSLRVSVKDQRDFDPLPFTVPFP